MHMRGRRTAQFASHNADVHGASFEDITALKNAGDAVAAVGILPWINLEKRPIRSSLSRNVSLLLLSHQA